MYIWTQTLHVHLSKLRVSVVRLARFFLKFVTKSIKIGFLIIKTDAYRLGLVFRPIVVQCLAVDLISLVGLKHLKFYFFFFIKKICPTYSHIKSVQKKATKSIQISQKLHKKICSTCSHIKYVQFVKKKTATKFVQILEKLHKKICSTYSHKICSNFNRNFIKKKNVHPIHT